MRLSMDSHWSTGAPDAEPASNQRPADIALPRRVLVKLETLVNPAPADVGGWCLDGPAEIEVDVEADEARHGALVPKEAGLQQGGEVDVELGPVGQDGFAQPPRLRPPVRPPQHVGLPSTQRRVCVCL